MWADEHHWTVYGVLSSEWSIFHLHLCIILAYQCIWGWQHLQKPSPKCHFTYIFWLFIFRSTHDSAECWRAHRSPVCVESAAGCHPPNKNPAYAGGGSLYIYDNVYVKPGVHTNDFVTIHGRPARVIFFSTLVPGSGNFQLSRLAGLGYGLGLGFWVVITIIVSLTLTLTLITTVTVILP